MTDPNQPNQPYTPPTAPPAYEAPAYPNAPQYDAGAPAAGAPVPGRTMGIVAFILSFFLQLIALILGIVALVQSRKAGQKNGFALAAIIISVVLGLVIIGITIAVISLIASAGGDLVSQVNACLEDPSGTVTWQGVTMTCEELLESNGY